ncbi:MAG: hypothetical protein A2X08_15480 [Bacteroidetes bacterium GWA2_32_17]|nr:MAG: hypothetical protein A2X08_15480 [Bacteroidetes bacterium GWA2_32_17]
MENIVTTKELITGYYNNGKFSAIPQYQINIAAKEGELIALIGSNGNGKTTLLKTLAGLQKYKSGEINIFGNSPKTANKLDFAKVLSIATTELLKIAYTSVYEFVMLGRYPYSNFFGKIKNDDIEIVNMALNETGIIHKKDELLNRLSDGERQRAVIARTLSQNTNVILLDEPTAFLDIKNKFEIFNLLKTLTLKFNKTIIFSTHDINTAIHIADKIWLLKTNCIINKIPEQIIFDDDLANEFNSDYLQIDKNSGNLNFINKSSAFIGLEGNSKIQTLTKNAFNRIGFEISSNKNITLNVIIEEKGNSFIWKLNDKNEIFIFNQLEELLLHLKFYKLKN